MSKIDEAPINKTDIQEYIQNHDDFALELYTYKLAREKGFSATHGGSYLDPLTNKIRQYDVRAVIQKGNLRIALAIECKNLKSSYPLVINRIPRSADESFHQGIYSRGQDNPIFLDSPTSDILIANGFTSIYKPDELVGKNTTQIGRNQNGGLVIGDQEVFEKWSQALSSANDLIDEAMRFYWASSNQITTTVVIPILVISKDTLWAIDYTEQDAIEEIHQVESATIYVGREYVIPCQNPYIISHLHICTKDGLRGMLSSFGQDISFWMRLFKFQIPSD